MGGFYMKMSNVKTSTVSKSAYNSRTKEYDETQGRTFNYSSKEDHVYHNVTLPEGCPEEWKQAEKLWNANEKFETKQNTTRHGKQFIVAIPQELTQEQTEKAINEFQGYFAKMGYASQADQHEPESERSKNEVEKNRHVHILTTARKIENGEFEQIKEKKMFANDRDENGKPIYNPEKPDAKDHKEYRQPVLDEKGEQKFRERPGKGKEMLWERVRVQDNPLDRRETVEAARAEWARICNSYLSEDQQIDHRSYERQGSDKVAQIHEGVGSHKEQDERKQYNEEVKKINAELDRAKQTAGERIKEKGERSNDHRQGETISGDNHGADGVGGRTESRPGEGADIPQRDERPFAREDGRASTVEERFSRLTDKAQEGVAVDRGAADRPGANAQDRSAGDGRTESGERTAKTAEHSTMGGQRGVASGYRQRVGEAQNERSEVYRGLRERISDNFRSRVDGLRERLDQVGKRYTEARSRVKEWLTSGFKGVLERTVQRDAEQIKAQAQPKQTTENPMNKMQMAQQMNAAAEPKERSEDDMGRGANSLLAQAKEQNQAADERPREEDSRAADLLKAMQEQKADQEFERNERIISEALKHMDAQDRATFEDGHELNDQERDYLEKKYCQQKGTFNQFDEHGRNTGKTVERMYTPSSERDMNEKQKAVWRYITNKPKQGEDETQNQTVNRSFHR